MLTECLDTLRLAAIQLNHAFNLLESDVIVVSKVVSGLVRTRHHSFSILRGKNLDTNTKQQTLIVTFVTDDMRTLTGCSPSLSITVKSSPKSQKIWLQRTDQYLILLTSLQIPYPSSFLSSSLPKQPFGISNNQFDPVLMTTFSNFNLLFQ